MTELKFSISNRTEKIKDFVKKYNQNPATFYEKCDKCGRYDWTIADLNRGEHICGLCRCQELNPELFMEYK